VTRLSEPAAGSLIITSWPGSTFLRRVSIADFILARILDQVDFILESALLVKSLKDDIFDIQRSHKLVS
jgi:hypothetical protein